MFEPIRKDEGWMFRLRHEQAAYQVVSLPIFTEVGDELCVVQSAIGIDARPTELYLSVKELSLSMTAITSSIGTPYLSLVSLM